MTPTENCEACAVSEADALTYALMSRDAERTRANDLERRLKAITERCAHFEADVERFIRENAAQREQIQEIRAALRAMAYLITEAQIKAQSQALAR